MEPIPGTPHFAAQIEGEGCHGDTSLAEAILQVAHPPERVQPPDFLLRVEEQLGYQFCDWSLLRRALTHSSSDRNPQNNLELLEYLGDSVLELVVAELLIERMRPREVSGRTLSHLATRYLNNDFQADQAEGLNLREAVQVRGNVMVNGNGRRIMADCFEAIFGAAFLDGGLSAARELGERLIGPSIVTDGVEDRENSEPRREGCVVSPGTRDSIISQCEAAIGYRFRDRNLLISALGLLPDPDQRALRHERLNFLGHGVLKIQLTNALLEHTPDATLGYLDTRRADVMRASPDFASTSSRKFMALCRDHPDYLPGMEPRFLFRAVLGAVHADGGSDRAYRILRSFIGSSLDSDSAAAIPLDGDTSKRDLKLLLSGFRSGRIQYITKQVPGKSTFECALWIKGIEEARVRDRDPIKAEQHAARVAIENIESIRARLRLKGDKQGLLQ